MVRLKILDSASFPEIRLYASASLRRFTSHVMLVQENVVHLDEGDTSIYVNVVTTLVSSVRVVP